METEQQQVEALQRWWNDNGRAVIVALVIAFGGLGGYSWWQHTVQRNAEGLSLIYQQVVDAANEDDLQQVLSRTDTLISQHPDSAYAALASLRGAASAHAAGDPAAARRLLLWASEHAEQNFIRNLARLRLARLMLDQQQYDEALMMIDRVDVSALDRMKGELTGDILLAQDKVGEAREAYAKLLEGEVDDEDRARLQGKVDMVASLAPAR